MEHNNKYSEKNKEHKETQEVRNTAPGRRKRRAAGAVLCALLLSAAFVAAAYGAPNLFLPEKRGYVHVRSDMTASEVADMLSEQGYIASPLLFRAAAVATGQAGDIKEGEYVIDTSMSVHSILEKLTSGKSEALRLVVPEGYTVWRIAKEVAAMGKISEKDFLAAAKKEEYLYPYMKTIAT